MKLNVNHTFYSIVIFTIIFDLTFTESMKKPSSYLIMWIFISTDLRLLTYIHVWHIDKNSQCHTMTQLRLNNLKISVMILVIIFLRSYSPRKHETCLSMSHITQFIFFVSKPSQSKSDVMSIMVSKSILPRFLKCLSLVCPYSPGTLAFPHRLVRSLFRC